MESARPSRKLIRIGIGEAVPNFPDWEATAQFPPKLKWRIVNAGENVGAPTGLSVGNFAYWQLNEWLGFVEHFNMTELFYAKGTGLFCENMSRIAAKHAIEFEQKLAQYRAAHPDAIAKKCKCIECIGRNPKNAEHDSTADGTLATLVWLAYWTRWAISRCRTPAISQ